MTWGKILAGGVVLAGGYMYTRNENKNKREMEERLKKVEDCNAEQAEQLTAAKCLAEIAQKAAKAQAKEGEQLKSDFYALRSIHHQGQLKLENMEEELSSIKMREASLQKRVNLSEQEVTALKDNEVGLTEQVVLLQASEAGLKASLKETRNEVAVLTLETQNKASGIKELNQRLSVATEEIAKIKAQASSAEKTSQETILSLKKENSLLEASLLVEKTKTVQAKESSAATIKIAQKELVATQKNMDGIKNQCEASKTQAWKFKALAAVAIKSIKAHIVEGEGITERDANFLLRTMSTRMKEVEGNTLPTLDDATTPGKAAGRILGKALGHVREEARLHAINANESQSASDWCED